MRMARKTFERIVREENVRVLKSLSPDLRARAESVTILVADRPTRRESGLTKGYDLLGLYEGVSLTDRHVGDMEVVADQITLFRLPLLDACDSTDELREEIRITLLHELGHYFGFEENELLKHGL
jgi:predicted Zn-dependent protease with MMP-like domain